MSYSEEIVSGFTLSQAVGHLGPHPCDFWVSGVGNTSLGFTDAMLGRHVLFIGGIGTGKTVGMSSLIRSVRHGLGPQDVLVFFDTKGDYLASFGREGDAIVAATTSGDPRQRYWNVFEEFRAVPSGRDVEDEVLEVSNGLFSNLLQNAGDNVYFANAARDLFVALLTALLRDSTARTNRDIRLGIAGMSIAEMHELLDRPGNEDLRGAKHYIAKEGSPSAMAALAFMQ